jgi:hypothetical protein
MLVEPFVDGGGLANEEKRLGLGVSEDAVCSGALTVLNRDGFGVPAGSSGSLMDWKGLLAALGVCPKVKGADSGLGNCPNALLAGADAGVPAVPNMFSDGAEVVVLAAGCAFENWLNKLVEGAVAVAFPVACALVPVPNMLFCGASCWLKPLNKFFCAGVALLCVPLKPPNMLLGAGVPGFCALELAAPKVKDADGAASVPGVCAVELGPPKAKDVGAAAGVPMGAADVPNMFVEGALLVMVPNMPPVLGALLVLVPNMLPVLAALVVFICAEPPKGLLGGCENMEPPKAGEAPLPFPFIAGELAKGFAPLAVKLKSLAAGGWGLKPVVWLLAPNAGKDELEKVLLGAADCAGGKLFVAPPPNALVLAPNMPFVLLLPPTAGADAPKLKLEGAAPKFALCKGAWTRGLANRRSWSTRTLRLPLTVWMLCFLIVTRIAMANAAGGVG